MLNTHFPIISIVGFLLVTAAASPLLHAATVPAQQQAELASGPMPGHSTTRAVSVWLQGNTDAEVVLDYWPDGQPGKIRRSQALSLNSEQQYTAHITIDGLEPAPAGHRPTLFYCVRHAEDATAIDILRVADAEGRIDLVVVASSEGPRFSEATLREHFGDDGLRGAHIAACGPSALVDTAMTTGDKMGAASLESEDFDIRGGFGPDMSKEIDQALSRGVS